MTVTELLPSTSTPIINFHTFEPSHDEELQSYYKLIQEALAHSTPSEAIIPTSGCETYELENGMTLYVRHETYESQEKPFFDLKLILDGGSNEEDQELVGAAHLIEHLAFQSLRHFPEKQEFVKSLEAAGVSWGAHLNASTERKNVTYKLSSIPRDNQDLIKNVLLVINDWSQGILFEQEIIDAERKIVLREATTDPQSIYQASVIEDYLKHPGSDYALKDPIGLPKKVYQRVAEEGLKVLEDIRREDFVWGDEDYQFTASQLKAFYDQCYQPHKLSLLLVGDLGDSLEERKKLIGLFLEECNKIQTRGEKKQKSTPKPSSLTFKQSLKLKTIEIPELPWSNVAILIQNTKSNRTKASFGWLKDSIVRSMAIDLLSLRIQRFVDETPQLFSKESSVDFELRSKSGGKVFSELNVTSPSEKIAEVILRVGTIIRGIQIHGVRQQEFDGVYRKTLNTQKRRMERRSTQQSVNMARLCNYAQNSKYFNTQRQNALLRYLILNNELNMSVTLNDIHEAMQDLNLCNPSVVIANVPTEKQKMLEEIVSNTLAELRGLEPPKLEETSLTPSEMIIGPTSRDSTCSIINTEEISELSSECITLSNGITAYFISRKSANNEVYISMNNPQGYRDLTRDEIRELQLAKEVAGLAWGSYNRSDLRDWRHSHEHRVGGVSYSIGKSNSLYSTSCNKDSLSACFDLLYYYLEDKALLQDQKRFKQFYEATKESTKEGLLESENTPLHKYNYQAEKFFSSNHPNITSYTSNDYNDSNPERATELLAQKKLLCREANLVIVADFERNVNLNDQLKELLLSHIAPLSTKPQPHCPPKYEPVKVTEQDKVQDLYLNPDMNQCYTTMILPASKPQNSRELSLRHLQIKALLRFLYDELREDKQLVYGIDLDFDEDLLGINATRLTLQVETSDELYPELITSFKATLDRIKNGEADDSLIKITESTIAAFVNHLPEMEMETSDVMYSVLNYLQRGEDPRNIKTDRKDAAEVNPLEFISDLKELIKPASEWLRSTLHPIKT